ncbi:MAG: WbqC family protein [Bacteroidaceae bacterium]|nr:WbqC family protein [Bacteroidaceae bacterium]
MELLTHPLYLAPVPLYVQLYSADTLVVDDVSPFVKQTFRNRAVVAAENGAQPLTVPVVHDGAKVAMRDIRISEHGNWRHQHWNALVSAYRKSPFFEYYADDFVHFYEERDGFLMDFNLRLHAVVCDLLGLEIDVKFLSDEAVGGSGRLDMRHIAEPKALAALGVGMSQSYYQVFAQRNGFIPSLSIVDLLFNTGPEGLLVLRDSACVK